VLSLNALPPVRGQFDDPKEDRRMRVLVTGGAGFIGSNLCRRLVHEPAVDEVRVIDNLSTGFLENLTGLDIDFRQADILDAEALRRAAVGCSSIVHLAALGSVPRSIVDPEASHAVNATGTLRVLQAARDLDEGHVVCASSSAVYGGNPKSPKSEKLVCMPMSPYAVSKVATEQYAMAFAQCYELSVLPFRFFNVYGPGQRAGHAYAAVIPAFVDAALRGVPLPVFGDGEQSRDFTNVTSVCEVIARAVKQLVSGGPTNLAFGTSTTLNDLIELLETYLGRTLEVHREAGRAGDVRASQADNALLLSMFPDLKPVELSVGLTQTINWTTERLESCSSN
jgi:UDP-glucose 4-epimerase